MNNAEKTVQADKLPWLPLAAGIAVRVLRLAPSGEGYAVMIRAEPGGVLPRHRHLEESEIYIVSGNGTHPQLGDFHTGDYICEEKGAVHDEVHFTQETVLLMVSRGPSAFLAPDDSDAFYMDIPMLRKMVEQGSAQA